MITQKTFEILYSSCHGDKWEHCDTISAFDHEDAAEQWAEEYDSGGDYPIISNGESEEILVREEGKMDTKKFKVFAESRPHYSAKELK